MMFSLSRKRTLVLVDPGFKCVECRHLQKLQNLVTRHYRDCEYHCILIKICTCTQGRFWVYSSISQCIWSCAADDARTIFTVTIHAHSCSAMGAHLGSPQQNRHSNCKQTYSIDTLDIIYIAVCTYS